MACVNCLSNSHIFGLFGRRGLSPRPHIIRFHFCQQAIDLGVVDLVRNVVGDPVLETLHGALLDTPWRIDWQAERRADLVGDILVSPGIELIPHDHRVAAGLNECISPGSRQRAHCEHRLDANMAGQFYLGQKLADIEVPKGVFDLDAITNPVAFENKIEIVAGLRPHLIAVTVRFFAKQ